MFISQPKIINLSQPKIINFFDKNCLKVGVYVSEFMMATCTSSATGSLLLSQPQSCQICYEEYSEVEKRIPRVLLCGHTFCTG